MGQVRVLVVDDSVIARRLVTQVLTSDPGIEVVGTAADGRAAVEAVAALRPDLVTMDLEMPVMDGTSAVRILSRTHPGMPVVVVSAFTARGAEATLEALAAGAADYVTKPTGSADVLASLDALKAELLPRVKALAGRAAAAGAVLTAAPPAVRDEVDVDDPAPLATLAELAALAQRGQLHVPDSPAWLSAPVPAPRREPVVPAGPPAPAPAALGLAPVPRSSLVTPEVLLVGASTGGPEALAALVGALPADLPVPVLVVQHMPPVFTAQLAARLDRLSALSVVEAKDGARLRPGTVHVAPGGRHLAVTGTGSARRTALHDGAPENYCRPSVDVLFRGAVEAYGPACLAVVLTGMGRDGRDGAALVRAAGGRVLVQDQATSVVWGMPGAVATAGLADEVLPLAELPGAVERHLRSGTPAPRTRRDSWG